MKESAMKIKAIFFAAFIVLISTGFALGQSIPSSPPKIIPASDGSWLNFYGFLCHDTDDGKIYKWNGAALEEVGAGSSTPPTVQSVTCTDSGDGNPGTVTITPTAGLNRVDISLTVNDAHGCTVTMAETGAVEETLVIITNVSAANKATFTTSAGVLALKYGSPFEMGAKDSLHLLYKGAEWLEVGRIGIISGFSIGGFGVSKVLCSNASGIAVDCTNLTDTVTGTGSVVLATSPTIASPAITAPEIDGSGGVALSAAQVSRTIINNYGQAAANINNTLPAAAAGMTFIGIVGTAQAANYWRFTSGSANIYANVGAGLVSGKTYVSIAVPTVGARISCFTFKTGAAAWSWMCGSSEGTWSTD